MADTLAISRHLPAPQIRSYMTRAAVDDLSRPDLSPPEAADGSGRSAQTFLVEVVVRRGGEERRAAASGRDIYAMSAPLVVEAARRVVTGLVETPGAFSAGEMRATSCRRSARSRSRSSSGDAPPARRS
jgi:hypothetical protein